MSSYAEIYVRGKEIASYRNEVFQEVLQLFTEEEFAHLEGDHAQPYASYRNRVNVDGEPVEENEVYIYRVHAGKLRDRLNVLGFGARTVKRIVEGLVRQEARSQARLLEYAYSETLEGFRAGIEADAEALCSFDYDAWKLQVAESISSNGDEPRHIWRDGGALSFFENIDVRLLLRVIVDQVGEEEPVVLDVTDLVHDEGPGNDSDPEDDLPPLWDTAAPPVIITEGRYDAQVLRGAIEVLKPHLASYIRFLDYDTGNEGGAAAAVRMLKSFAAAGVSNRIVALFDNDSAAYEAVMQLRSSRLPSHYAVMHYPDLELANAYPTLGPQGNTVMNVNRLAGSIEMYLGRDVLTAPDGTLTPVQWKGYMGKVGAYQGEIMSKSAIQRAFKDKLRAAKADPSVVASPDWSGLEAVLNALMDTLSALSSIGRERPGGPDE